MQARQELGPSDFAEEVEPITDTTFAGAKVDKSTLPVTGSDRLVKECGLLLTVDVVRLEGRVAADNPREEEGSLLSRRDFEGEHGGRDLGDLAGNESIRVLDDLRTLALGEDTAIDRTYIFVGTRLFAGLGTTSLRGLA